MDELPDDMDGEERPLSAIDKLMILAQAEGDISKAFTEEELSKIGADVVADYDRDKGDRKEWEEQVNKALSLAAQEKTEDKVYPWEKASNVKYPMLTIASLQFNARAYPAIVKGDEAVFVKTVGRDEGRPVIGPDDQPVMRPVAGPDGMPVLEPVWEREPGAKGRRAQRVREYLNTVIFYRVEGWEEDTDQLLMQLPIVGCVFRKVCYRDGEFHVRMVPALNIIAPVKARDIKTTPRLTEELPDVFPYQIDEKIATGQYRKVDLMPDGEDEQAPRLLLEQHRLMDLDEDGISEPYIITVDKETSQVLRIESNFSPREAMRAGGKVGKLSTYYIKYDFFPHPKGLFYGIGFGHLLDPLIEIVNTAINQLNDAATAANAGGGFIASGVRLQGNSSKVQFRPGEYKTVNGVTGSQLRDSIWERTLPNPSPITFQLLDLMLGAARDITSVQDVTTGEASNTGQVGTTLALIEQGLQVFTAVYKRVFRSLKAEFAMLYEGIGMWGGEAMARDYQEVLDDPNADLAQDFNASDMDIRPVSDPKSVTKMQKMAQAQFLGGFLGKGLNDQEIIKRMLEAADIEDIDALFPEGPPEPNPAVIAEVEKTQSETMENIASAQKKQAETVKLGVETGAQFGAMDEAGADFGGIPGMGGQPDDAMGLPGGQ